jgi:hypothetical protein
MNTEESDGDAAHRLIIGTIALLAFMAVANVLAGVLFAGSPTGFVWTPADGLVSIKKAVALATVPPAWWGYAVGACSGVSVYAVLEWASDATVEPTEVNNGVR